MRKGRRVSAPFFMDVGGAGASRGESFHEFRESVETSTGDGKLWKLPQIPGYRGRISITSTGSRLSWKKGDALFPKTRFRFVLSSAIHTRNRVSYSNSSTNSRLLWKQLPQIPGYRGRRRYKWLVNFL